jgi:protein O-GlcNAc transferase
MIGRWFRRGSPQESAAPRPTTANGAAEPTARHPEPAPATIDALVAKGMADLGAGRLDEAAATFEAVLAREPDHLVALYQRANARYTQGNAALARRHVDEALARLPGQPDLLMLAGAIAAYAHDPAGAIERFELARRANPDLAGIDARIGEQLAFAGRGAEAIAAYDRAIAREPDNFPLASSRLFLLNHFGLLDRQRTFEEHRRWGERLERAVAPMRRPHRNDPSPERPLRIGFVSADLRNHPIAFWIEGYLGAHDRVGTPIEAFDVSPYAEDDVTRRLRGQFDAWHRCGALGDDDLADLVRRQCIDVLVDLSGHTGHHRLAVFARKPAPVQASWFGYMNTSGLTTIDWRLTDAQHDPPGSDAYYTERLWRMPFLACFSPHPASPDPGPPPFERHGHVTFASANNWAKVSEGAKDAWAEILDRAPGARLKVIARGGDDARNVDAVRAEFGRRGIDGARVDVSPFLPLVDFLGFFRDVDVALDPFPYGGGTTTLHTLWMGVPVVALEGDSELARATPSTLRGVGAGEFVADSRERYVELAVALGRDPAPIASARARLRSSVRASVAMDYAGLARNVEAAFRGMWRAWCAEAATASRRV